MTLQAPKLDPFQKKLLAAFETTVSATGITTIFTTHPKAPHLLLTRNPKFPQNVPILIAGTLLGGAAGNALLGGQLGLLNEEYLPMSQTVTDNNGTWCVFLPYLFYRNKSSSEFFTAATEAAQELAETGTLTSWFIIKCSVAYLTKDGRTHHAEVYPDAFTPEEFE